MGSRYRYNDEVNDEEKKINARNEIEEFYEELKEKFDYVDRLFLQGYEDFYFNAKKSDLGDALFVKVGRVINGKMKYGIIKNSLIKAVKDSTYGVKSKMIIVPCIFDQIEKQYYYDDVMNQCLSMVFIKNNKSYELDEMTLLTYYEFVVENKVPHTVSRKNNQKEVFLDFLELVINHLPKLKNKQDSNSQKEREVKDIITR